ncbi:MAG: hypothetical protein GF388_00700, partial [Candidatus Aegiribacteria sp.]|nr:hypothetical protein [Candidatus Aegiribacteria sp.]
MRSFTMQFALSILLTSTVFAIPWPVGETQSEQILTHTIMNNYGDYHIPWTHVCEDSCNFHFGIDFDSAIPPTDGSEESENVWSVEAGLVTYVQERIYNPGPDQIIEYVIVICEDEFAEEGWCYQHIEPTGAVWVEDVTTVISGENIATMAELQELGPGHYRHLHLMRSLPVYENENPGLANPLAYFTPSPESPDFTWSYTIEAPNYYFFLPNTDAVDPDNQMEGGWGAEYPTVTEAQNAMFNNLYGADLDDIWGEVDFFGYVLGYGTGQEGGPTSHYIMPQKISWTLKEWDSGLSDWVPVQEYNGTDFIRYVVDFADIPLGGSDNWDEYKQFYFRFQPDELFSETPGRTCCLTNCTDANVFNGISNIEENCWNTALSAEGSGEAYNPENMLTPDGEYRATVNAYDWDGTEYEYSFNFMLHNNREIAKEVRLSDAATDQDIWHAEWVASFDTDGFEPVKNVYVNQTTEPGTTLDIEIVFSGPMSTSVAAWVRFTKPEGGYIVASPGSPEWTSTNQPDGYVDTWHGTVDVPAEGFSGWMTMKIK